MKDININAKVPEVARNKVSEALGYCAKVKEFDEEGVEKEVDNPETEEEFVVRDLKQIINNYVRRQIERKKKQEAVEDMEEVEIDVTLK